MFRFRKTRDVAFVLLVVLIASNVYAGNKESDDAVDSPPSGVLLNRLSPRHRKIWEEIRRIVYSADDGGNPLHPVLRDLFEQLHWSGHSIYIEFDDSRSGCRCTAGEFRIERLDPEGFRSVGVIKLHLRNIDYAAVPALEKVNDGFIPFVGLDKLDRYVEVLGHEMGHAVDILFTPELASQVDDVSRESDQIMRACRLRKGRIGPELMQIIKQRDAFFSDLEKPARLAEALVWRELVESRKKRKGQKFSVQPQIAQTELIIQPS